MAQAEFAKEKALLSEKFGVSLNFDYYVDNKKGRGFKEVVDALNGALNLKKIYERNKILIKESNGKKAVISYFPTYFMLAWEQMSPSIEEDWRKKTVQTGDPVLALETVLDTELPKVLVLGIKKMLDGPEVEIGKIPPELKDAYTSLISEIGTLQQKGSIANQLYQVYQLDKLKESLMDEIKGSIDMQAITNKARSMIKLNIHSRGGYTLEAIETAVFRQIGRAIEGKAIHAGDIGIKADNILTIGIDPNLVYQALERAGENRSKNIAALSELGEKIKNLDSGFIVYSSDKNYTLNNKFGGFSAGNAEKIETFLSRVYQNSSSLNTLIGAINQLGKGAMLADQEGAFEKMLAQDVAYMLFDDYATIGEADAGGNSIHIMNLNGIMIPLSMILELLADAIDSTYIDADRVRRIVNVDIKVPEIEFDTQDKQNRWQEQNPEQNAWDYQRQQTLKNSTISAKFLHSFRQIVQEFL